MNGLSNLFEGNATIWIIVGILAVICIIVSAKKQNTQQNGKSANAIPDEIGDKDLVVKPTSWYRTQTASQPVIERTEEQQRIVDEYFRIRNYKTTTCISAHKKKYKLLKKLGTVVLVLGIALSAFLFLKHEADFEDALENPLFILGLVTIAGGLVCKFVAGRFKKAFEDSIKHSTAPKAVMTDEEYEQLVDQKIEEMDIKALGLDRLGLDPDQIKEINPIILRDKVIEKYSFTVYNDEDESTHSSTQHVTYLYFTDEQLFVYKIVFDMCCNVQDEWAHEFFYTDICDIRSYTSRNILKTDHGDFEYSTVAFDIISTNSEIGFVIDGDNENINSLQAMKQKIRERKTH